MNDVILPHGITTVKDLYPDLKETQDFARLTKKQISIVLLILKAMKNKEIAYELNLKLNTVAKYISVIYRKTRVSNRQQLIIKFSRTGQ